MKHLAPVPLMILFAAPLWLAACSNPERPDSASSGDQSVEASAAETPAIEAPAPVDDQAEPAAEPEQPQAADPNIENLPHYATVPPSELPMPYASAALSPEEIVSNAGRPGVARLYWSTQSEENNFGFRIMRAREEDGEFEQVNDTIIQGAGNSSTQHRYYFADLDVKVSETWHYRIDQIDMNGNVTPQSRPPHTINRLYLGGRPDVPSNYDRVYADGEPATEAPAATTASMSLAQPVGRARAGARPAGEQQANASDSYLTRVNPILRRQEEAARQAVEAERERDRIRRATLPEQVMRERQAEAEAERRAAEQQAQQSADR